MSIRRALVFSFIDRYAGLVIHTASTMVLARLLTPAEIGIYSVVMVLLGFVATFRDLGAAQYMVRLQVLTPEAMRATFTVQTTLSLTFAVLLLALSIPIATFYREPRMQAITAVLSLNFLVMPLLAYPNAWLVREMRFGTVAAVRFIGGLAHASTAIGLVLAGFGPISLAYANLATTVCGIVAIHLIARPKLPMKPTRKGLRAVLSFGGRLTLISLVDTLRAGTAELVLGRLQGLAVAGLLSRAQGTVAMFEQLVLNAVGQVALPYFSKETREGRSLGEPFLRALGLVTGLGWPFFGGLLLLAHPAIRLLYGNQWDAAVEPVRWLSLAASLALPGLICQSPLIAVGALKQTLLVSLFSLVLTVGAAVVGATQGLVVTAQALSLVALLSTAAWLRLARQHLGFDWQRLAQVVLRSGLLGLATMVLPLAVLLVVGLRPATPLWALLIGIPGGVLGFLLAARALRHDLWQEAERVLPWLRRLPATP